MILKQILSCDVTPAEEELLAAAVLAGAEIDPAYFAERRRAAIAAALAALRALPEDFAFELCMESHMRLRRAMC